MPRRRSGNRVLGPYPYRGKFRVIVCEEGGEKVARLFATEKEANLFREDVEVELKAQTGRTVAEALAAYQEYMRDVKQNRPSSIQTTLIRLRSFFTEPERVLSELTRQRCHGYYQHLLGRVSERTGEQPSVDSQRNTLAEARTFLNWCIKPQQWLKANPLAEVTGTGRRRHGKPQLRIDEARRLRLVCHEKARDGDDGAVAVLVGLLMGLRAQEIVTRTVRDLDDGGRILWVDANDQAKFSPKTKASRRPVPVWDEVRPYLSERTQGKLPQALLFPAEGGGGHWRDWVRKNTRRLCRLAQVPEFVRTACVGSRQRWACYRVCRSPRSRPRWDTNPGQPPCKATPPPAPKAPWLASRPSQSSARCPPKNRRHDPANRCAIVVHGTKWTNKKPRR